MYVYLCINIICARVCATAVATSAGAVAASATALPCAQACYVSIRQQTSAYVRIIDMLLHITQAQMCDPQKESIYLLYLLY